MLLDIVSRLLTVALAIAFTLVFTRGELPLVPKGRWTFVALFIVGFGLCTIAGIRDGTGTTVAVPTWLSALNGSLGFASLALLVAVLIGFSWRFGVGLLAVAIWASWLAALVFAISAGLPSALLGAVTLVVVIGVAGALAWPTFGQRQHPVRASN